MIAQQAAAGLSVAHAREQAGGEVEIAPVIRAPGGDDALHGGKVVVAEHVSLAAVRPQLREQGAGARRVAQPARGHRLAEGDKGPLEVVVGGVAGMAQGEQGAAALGIRRAAGVRAGAQRMQQSPFAHGMACRQEGVPEHGVGCAGGWAG